jgi:general secretion pathway protein B
MSYILEALKKADQERTLGKVPDLEAAHWGERRSSRSYRWVWIVGGLLLVNGALLVMLFGRNDAGVPATDGVSGQADSMPVIPVPRTVGVMTPPPREVVRPREPVYVPPTVAQTAPVKQRVTVMNQVTPPASAVTAPRGFVPRPAPVPATASGVPEWNDMSLEFRSGFTLPHIDVHVYSDNPKKRFILVELQKYREGETLDSGAVLEEIFPDSIQLYYQGSRFRVLK